MPTWPAWWRWELELSSHLFERMADRGFNEVEVRRMLSAAVDLRRDVIPGRWSIETHHRRKRWEVIVEPDADEQLLVVITAYPVES
jgi:hypothetical protein